MLVKICGITKLSEIEDLNALKPDYIGLVFAESKRKITKEQAKELINKLDKSIKTVGVFRNNTEEEIMDILTVADIDVIQLHGGETIEFVESLQNKTKKEIWKAASIKSKEDMSKALKYPVRTILVDGSNPGSGEIFPWKYLNNIETDKRIFLAGGINEDNVLEGISTVNPDGIDVSSGVEINDEYGRHKDFDKMKRLIDKVR